MSDGRPTIAYIDLKALTHNLSEVRRLAGGRKVLAVVKADAYGHGSVEVANALEMAGIDMLGVALVEEGARLREAGIRSEILVMGGVFQHQAEDLIEHDLTPTVFTYPQAEAFSAACVRRSWSLPVHVKVDTGMGRLGMFPAEAIPFIADVNRLPGLQVQGIMTHLADAAGPDQSFAKHQVKEFAWTLDQLAAQGIEVPLVHVAASAAIIDFQPALFNMVRPGIMLYGCYPSEHMKDMLKLEPVMSVKTNIMHLKRVEKGRPISYGRTFYTPRPSLIATIPMGYADGLNRRLSNRGQMLIGGKRCPIVGTVCMDLTMVDVTELDEVRFGDEVVIIGRQGNEEITADEVANLLDTISYEVLCGISTRVKREYLY